MTDNMPILTWGYDLRTGSVIVKTLCFPACIGHSVWWAHVSFSAGKGTGRFEMIPVITVVGLLDTTSEKKKYFKNS